MHVTENKSHTATLFDERRMDRYTSDTQVIAMINKKNSEQAPRNVHEESLPQSEMSVTMRSKSRYEKASSDLDADDRACSTTEATIDQYLARSWRNFTDRTRRQLD